MLSSPLFPKMFPRAVALTLAVSALAAAHAQAAEGELLFSQDFSAGGAPDDYLIKTTPDPASRFEHLGIEPEAEGFTPAIAEGAFHIKTEEPLSEKGGAGFLIVGNLRDSSPEQMQLEWVMTLSQPSGFGPMATLAVGEVPAQNISYRGGGSARDQFMAIGFRATGSTFKLENNGTDHGISDLNYDSPVTYRAFLNNSDSEATYIDPVSNSPTVLQPRKWSLYVDMGSGWMQAWANVPGRAQTLENPASPYLKSVWFGLGRLTNVSLDSITVRSGFSTP